MALQKHRVICPYCESILLVTEDLLGRPGTCPGCQQEFLLPEIESFIAADPASPSPAPAEAAPITSWQRAAPPTTDSGQGARSEFSFGPSPSPFPVNAPEPPRAPTESSGLRRQQKPVRMEGRPALRLLSGLMKILAGIQVGVGCLLLIVLVVLATRSPLPSELVLAIVGLALGIGMGAVPMLAFSELILVFIAQEEMLRHLVNHQREKETPHS